MARVSISVVAALAVSVCGVSSVCGFTTLVDEFNDSSLDSNVWTTVTHSHSQEDANVAVGGGVATLTGGIYIVSNESFVPTAAAPLHITGRWTKQHDKARMFVKTRAAVEPGAWGTSGVSFGLENNVVIRDPGCCNPLATYNPGGHGVGVGDVVDFTVIDDGSTLTFDFLINDIRPEYLLVQVPEDREGEILVMPETAPATGFEPDYRIALGVNECAGCQGAFDFIRVVPVPGSLASLALAGLLFVRRRR